jgi:hypothetical protein
MHISPDFKTLQQNLGCQRLSFSYSLIGDLQAHALCLACPG